MGVYPLFSPLLSTPTKRQPEHLARSLRPYNGCSLLFSLFCPDPWVFSHFPPPHTYSGHKTVISTRLWINSLFQPQNEITAIMSSATEYQRRTPSNNLFLYSLHDHKVPSRLHPRKIPPLIPWFTLPFCLQLVQATPLWSTRDDFSDPKHFLGCNSQIKSRKRSFSAYFSYVRSFLLLLTTEK